MSSDLSLVFESTNIVSASEIEFLQESNDGGIEKAIFKTKLQTADEINGNRRIYSTPICRQIIEGLSAKAKGRSLFQEIDHPGMVGDQEAFRRRAVTVELKNCGSLIRNISMEGKDIIGEVETLSGFMGPDLRDLIVKDKADIGFSLRMFSKVRPHTTLENVSEVLGPLRPVTYDVVTNPSHKKARVINLISEGTLLASLQTEDEAAVMEGMDDLMLLEGVNAPETSSEIITDYMNTLLKEAFNGMSPLKFKI